MPEPMICPNCGWEQDRNAECGKCGVIVSKYSVTQEKKREHALRRAHHANIMRKTGKALGVTVVGLLIAIPVAVMVLFLNAFSPHGIESGEHLNSVDWLPPSATDISFSRADGFGWFEEYTCSISEDDFYELAAREGWVLEGEGSILSYEDRRPNGGGTSVFYDTDSKRLSVSSRHR